MEVFGVGEGRFGVLCGWGVSVLGRVVGGRDGVIVRVLVGENGDGRCGGFIFYRGWLLGLMVGGFVSFDKVDWWWS